MPIDVQRAGEIDRASLFHPFTSVADHMRDGPLVMTEGRGVRIKDIHGREYLDGMAGLWCVNLGYGRSEITEAIAEQSRRLPFFHAFNSMSTDAAIECAEALLRCAPSGMARVFFGTSGSDANETQLKLIWFY
jgi:L-2,4-diaminobutyrate transaminase